MSFMVDMTLMQPLFNVGEKVRYAGVEAPVMTVRSIVEAETLPGMVNEVRYVVEWRAGEKMCVGNVCELSLVANA